MPNKAFAVALWKDKPKSLKNPKHMKILPTLIGMGAAVPHLPR